MKRKIGDDLYDLRNCIDMTRAEMCNYGPFTKKKIKKYEDFPEKCQEADVQCYASVLTEQVNERMRVLTRLLQVVQESCVGEDD